MSLSHIHITMEIDFELGEYNVGTMGNMVLFWPLLYLGTSQVVLVVKNLPANAGNLWDLGSIPILGRSPEEKMATHSIILASSTLMDTGAWWAPGGL